MRYARDRPVWMDQNILWKEDIMRKLLNWLIGENINNNKTEGFLDAIGGNE